MDSCRIRFSCWYWDDRYRYINNSYYFVSLVFLNNVEKREYRRNLKITVTEISIVDQIFSQFHSRNIVVKDIHFKKEQSNSMIIISNVLAGKSTIMKDVYYDLLKIEQLKQIKEVKQV
ncbi:hypothetical protein ACS127_04450 [Amphibacillus sp. Q70]|uniref:hypothetical protein n=1 Tax=Amphibacillus sp. Q70 TaxID=3453416 RepID=UPI003F86CFEA